MDHSAHIVGVATTAMHRRDLGIEQMAHRVVAEALSDAGVDASEVGLVIFGNATSGRLLDQACIRGQSFLREAGLRNAGIVNVDNSCAGGASALHLANLATLGGAGMVLAVGAEKMWTGDRAATLAGIEDGVPLVDRTSLHRTMENPSGSVLMALNASWAISLMDERGATVEQFAAAAVKARKHGSLNPDAQFRKEVTVEEVLASPAIVPPLTRLMCSSFTDGAAAVVLTGAPVAGAPRIRASTSRSGNGDLDYHERLAETAARPPGTTPASTPRTSTSSSSTTRRARRSSTRSSHSASSSPGMPDLPPWPVRPPSAGEASRSTRAAGWSPGAIRSAQRASPRWSSSSPSSAATPAPGRSRAPDWRSRPTRVA